MQRMDLSRIIFERVTGYAGRRESADTVARAERMISIDIDDVRPETFEPRFLQPGI